MHAGLAAQRAVIGDGEAVRLVADALNQVQRGGMMIQHHRLLLVGQVDFLQPLSQAKHGHVDAHGQHGFARKAQLLRAAVDQHQIGHHPALGRILPQRAGKTPSQHLVHGGKVVGPLHGFDAVMAILPVGRLAVDKHHHRGHRQHALRVGNIKAFDALGIALHANGLSQRLARAHRALLANHALRVALFQRVSRIALGQQHQRALFAALRGEYIHRAAAPLTQKLGDHLRLLHRHGQDFACGQTVGIVAQGELGQHALRRLVALARQGEAVAADHAPAADDQHLRHRVQPILGQRQHILLRIVGLDGALPLHQALHIAQRVALLGGQLIVHFLGRGPHFLIKSITDFLAVAVQKGHHAVDDLRVLLLAAQMRARRFTAANFIIDARARGRFERQLFITGADRKHPAHHLQRVAHSRRADIGAKILRAVLLHAAGDGDARKGLAAVDAHIGVVLVVLEQDVVMRLVQLDQVAFQCQRLQIGIAQQDVKVIHLRHHGGYLGGMLLGMEIAAHAVFQVDRFAHIDDLALMLHQVAAGAVGQHGQLGSQVFAQHRARRFLSIGIVDIILYYGRVVNFFPCP